MEVQKSQSLKREAFELLFKQEKNYTVGKNIYVIESLIAAGKMCVLKRSWAKFVLSSCFLWQLEKKYFNLLAQKVLLADWI